MDKPNELVTPGQSAGVVSDGKKTARSSNSDDSYSKRDVKSYHTTNYNESRSPSNVIPPNANAFQSNNTMMDRNELPRTSNTSEIEVELKKDNQDAPSPSYGRYSEMDPNSIKCVCSPQPSEPYLLPCGGTERCEPRYGPPPEVKYSNRRGCHHCRQKKKSCSIQ